MAATTSGTVQAGVNITKSNLLIAGINITTPVNLPSGGLPIAFAPGTGPGQISDVWSDTRSYNATPTVHDLTALTAAATNTGLGAFAKIKVLHVQNNEAADSGKDIIVGANATTPFVGPLGGTTPTITVKAGCSLLIYDLSTAGWTCSTAKFLKLDPGANNVSVTLTLAGN